MKQTRAEIKYGKTNDKMETDRMLEQQQKVPKWLDSSDDEDENVEFDINFLKNARTSNVQHV